MTPTIKDVAKYAGVSTATVSRVINNEAGVKEANVKKVREAIQACHFIPNSIARSLKCDRTNTIGFLVSDISNQYFTRMAKVISDHLHQYGYDMVICSTDEDAGKEINHLNRFISNRVNGIILNTTNKNDEFVAALSQTMPIVLIERQIHSSRFQGDYVGANNFGGIYAMTEYLLSLGHRKIGFINSELAVNTGSERMAGFTQAMAAANINVDANYQYLYISKFFSFDGGYSGAEHLMSLSAPPTAVIAANNTLALGVMSYLKEHHITIPKDLSFCSYGDIENSDLLFVTPTYSTLNPVSSGNKAASFLVTRIEAPDQVNREAVFDSQLIVGDSTAHQNEVRASLG